jgi:pyruvate formate lyase activating enzyme
MHEAMFWETLKNNKVQCRLCPHNCKISEGKRGTCKVRVNEEGTLYSLVYGLTSPGAVDPIEKKPLYNFHPGSMVYSFGTIGCNFRCKHCQNYYTSQAEPDETGVSQIPPKNAVRLALANKCKGVAWTYNEPTIWYEYTYDGSMAAKKLDLYTVYVTNGYINPEPLLKISPFLDAMNVDVKAFDDMFYKKICGGKLAPVKATCELARKLGIHLEITNLLIPGYNDDPDEIRSLCNWIVTKLGDRTPLHFSRFHPDYKLKDAPPTPEETLVKAHGIAVDEGLKFVYLGNILHPELGNTYCPKCKKPVIERGGFFSKTKIKLKKGKCTKCGELVIENF